ncbi:GNAT family N-acetyltransferase [Schaalia sp. lx-260]|uniref:GNAT family N-acetyltransferase n=1 Tax=Schaalia sp. lx-260 TaxID=2899082 RepID=UPI001E34BEC9|nr:GNAT family N-acetyltransferase [Schaalia sp. lx-260]MCD4549051.1 GNAT family N-acetyltransferase [Schaalia sp. lx-260]
MAATLHESPAHPWSKHWPHVRDLYLHAFPPKERLSLIYLLLSSLRPSCSFSTWTYDEKFAGLTYRIIRKDVVFLLFLAVHPEARSHGIGSRILKKISEIPTATVTVLQVEPCDEEAPNADQRRKRWDFYIRNSFRPAPLLSDEAGQTYATMIRGRDITAAEFYRILKGFMPPFRPVNVREIPTDKSPTQTRSPEA